ncbi:MAG: alkaline phosphatase family protein [Acinetobacter sp.]|nr:alkaline phosphatase family protein [Acinetobacter sp.]
MKIKYPTVGPILGETTSNHIRLLIRGELEWTDGVPRWCHGVIQIKKSTNKQYGEPQYFKLNPNFDMTGIAIVEGLESDTSYDYAVGWVFSEVDSSDIDVKKVLDWSNAATGKFCTGSNDRNQSRSVIAGSCRYMLKLLGNKWFDDRGDKTFRSIKEIVDHDKTPINQLIMVGDQIYADDLNIIGADKNLDDYLKRYREVFTQPNIRDLMKQIPTYMTLDDHEITDNWPAKASPKDFVTKFPAAMHAYQTYQLSHSPCIPIKSGKLDGTPTKLWYSYSDGCLDVFAMDTRTERQLDNNSRKMISKEQITALKAWLNDGSGAVKLILTSVPVVGSDSLDKWAGFPAQRFEILNFIMTKAIPKVVFLSGDVHASWSCELSADYIDAPKIISIVSSAFFWPYPVALTQSFQQSGKVSIADGKYISLSNASKICRSDNFTRIDFSSTQIVVSIYERKGKRFAQKIHEF